MSTAHLPVRTGARPVTRTTGVVRDGATTPAVWAPNAADSVELWLDGSTVPMERGERGWWVSPTSAAAQEKAYFDSNFGPFYRMQKTFLVNDTQPSGPGPVLSYDTLKWWAQVEKDIEKIVE